MRHPPGAHPQHTAFVGNEAVYMSSEEDIEACHHPVAPCCCLGDGVQVKTLTSADVVCTKDRNHNPHHRLSTAVHIRNADHRRTPLTEHTLLCPSCPPFAPLNHGVLCTYVKPCDGHTMLLPLPIAAGVSDIG